IDPTCGTLDVSHEVRISRGFSLANLTRFHIDDTDAEYILDTLKGATEVSLQCREHMKMLSRLGPSTRYSQGVNLDWIMNVLQPTLDYRQSSAVILCGSPGIGKSILSYHIYKCLLRKCRSSESIITHFAFDNRDHRRRSVTAMLSKMIYQILANEPDLFPYTTEPSQQSDLGWTEGNMWVQFRSIVRRAKSRTLVLIVDSIHDCDAYDAEEVLRNLFNLRFARPEGLKLICTTDIGLVTPSMEPVTTITIDTLDQLKDSWEVFVTRQVDEIVSENPKFEAVKDNISRSLAGSDGFLHSTLLAHCIRTITCLSQPNLILEEMNLLGTSSRSTIFGMMKGCAPWVASAVSWMLFVRRPLKPLELAVAITLKESTSDSPPSFQTYSKNIIPQDISGDLKRHLGPLVDVEDEEIRISHVYVGKVLQEWVNSMPESTCLNYRKLTRLCLEYLHFCLDHGIKNEEGIPSETAFQFSEYVLENWHIHYKDAMNNPAGPVPLDVEDDEKLRKLAYALFTIPHSLPRLYPAEKTDTVTTSDYPVPAYLAAQLGLFDIVKRVLPDPNVDSSTILQIACRYGHLEIVCYLIERVNDSTKIETELDRACLRGDANIFNVLLERFKALLPNIIAPHYILVNACRIGHITIANTLIEAGADIKGTNGSSPLEQALDQGHFDVADLLLKKGVNVNTPLPDGSNPLQRSILRGYSHISERLLTENGIRDDPDINGITSVHLAARCGNVSLLEKVFNLPRRELKDDKAFTSPLHEAAAAGHLNVIRILLDSGLPVDSMNSNGRTALFLALSNDHKEVVSELFSRGATIPHGEKYSASALKQAVIHGNLDATRRLLRSTALEGETNIDIESPLTDAVKGDFADIVRELLEAGANPKKTVDPGLDIYIIDEPAGLGWTAMHFAAYYGSVAAMRVLIELCYHSVNIKSVSGHTPLHLAVLKGQQNVVESMLQADPTNGLQTSTSSQGNFISTTRSRIMGLDINCRSREGLTPLHIAAMGVNFNLVLWLARHGANVNACDDHDMRPIHFLAASGKYIEAEVRCLLTCGADLNFPDQDGWTALSYAVQAEDEDTVFLLLGLGSDPNGAMNAAKTPLQLATLNGSVGIVKKLLDVHADPNRVDKGGYSALHGARYSALHGACFYSFTDIVDLLIQYDANINAADSYGNRPLHEAARRGHTDVVKQLLKANANINVTNERSITPLQRSIMNKWFPTALFLLEKGADPNIRDENGDTALMAAFVSTADDELINALLKNHAEPNIANKQQMTPLMRAATFAPEHVFTLLRSGANILSKGPDGTTALHIVAKTGSTSTLEYIMSFLKDKDKLNVKDDEGLAPIHAAARSGRGTLITALCKHGANVSERDSQGRTIMHHAVRSFTASDFKDVFEDFIELRADNYINVADDDGWTPLHWACRGAQTEIVSSLVAGNSGKQVNIECNRGWTPYDIAIFHIQDDLRQTMERILDTQGTTTTSADFPEAKPRNSRRVTTGIAHGYIRCGNCLYPIFGIRFKCNVHHDFDLCFKCRWSAEKCHNPRHTFLEIGEGPTEGPPLDSNTLYRNYDTRITNRERPWRKHELRRLTAIKSFW
ncbi:ankyrin repeat-containing domain protein, partial [Hypoxylon sp. FL1150]